jgi:glutamate racemase
VPGNKEIKDVFADGIHLTNVGSYVVGCTHFATLYRENPKGLPGEPYKVTDSKLAEVIQDTVWKVVSTHELAGVAKATAVGGKASFKGGEVYVRQQDGNDYFSLLPHVGS